MVDVNVIQSSQCELVVPGFVHNLKATSCKLALFIEYLNCGDRGMPTMLELGCG